MKTYIFTAIAGAIIFGGWLHIAFAQSYPPSPYPPEPGQQTLEEQNEIFRMMFMTDKEEGEFNNRLFQTDSASERRMVLWQQNQKLRQRAEQHGFTSHGEYLPGFPSTGGRGPGTTWWCLRYGCPKEEPLIRIRISP